MLTMIDFNKLLILVYNGLLFIEWFLNVISIELMIAGINTFLVWVACELMYGARLNWSSDHIAKKKKVKIAYKILSMFLDYSQYSAI